MVNLEILMNLAIPLNLVILVILVNLVNLVNLVILMKLVFQKTPYSGERVGCVTDIRRRQKIVLNPQSRIHNKFGLAKW